MWPQLKMTVHWVRCYYYLTPVDDGQRYIFSMMTAVHHILKPPQVVDFDHFLLYLCKIGTLLCILRPGRKAEDPKYRQVDWCRCSLLWQTWEQVHLASKQEQTLRLWSEYKQGSRWSPVATFTQRTSDTSQFLEVFWVTVSYSISNLITAQTSGLRHCTKSMHNK